MKEVNYISELNSYNNDEGTQVPVFNNLIWLTTKEAASYLRKSVNSEYSDKVLPRSKDWDNGDQAVPLKRFLKSINVKPIKIHALRACFATQMLANGVPAPVVMKIGGWKKSATMDIYLRLAGVDVKGATDCLEFCPNDIKFGDNLVELNKYKLN